MAHLGVHWRGTAIVGALALMLGGCARPQGPVFNGHDLTGWTKHGGDSTYSVEDGCIVGRRGPGPNTFLCTDRRFADFDLELDFRWDELCNSGIQFRSKVYLAERRVGGYQCELDPSDRSWSCGLFYEGPEGRWIVPLEDNDEARAARRLDGWNHIRIRAEGHHIQTWLNGVPCVDYIDTGGDVSGFIGLQVHGGPKGVLRWKNIQLTEL